MILSKCYFPCISTKPKYFSIAYEEFYIFSSSNTSYYYICNYIKTSYQILHFTLNINKEVYS